MVLAILKLFLPTMPPRRAYPWTPLAGQRSTYHSLLKSPGKHCESVECIDIAAIYKNKFVGDILNNCLYI